jgi:hypothetical protein
MACAPGSDTRPKTVDTRSGASPPNVGRCARQGTGDTRRGTRFGIYAVVKELAGAGGFEPPYTGIKIL